MSIIPYSMSARSPGLSTLEDASDSEERHRTRLRWQLSTTSSRLTAFTEWVVSGAEAESSRQNSGLRESQDTLEALSRELESQLRLLGNASKLENVEDKALFEETRGNIIVLWHEYQQHAFMLVDGKRQTKK